MHLAACEHDELVVPIRGYIQHLAEQLRHLLRREALACFNLAYGDGGASDSLGKLFLGELEGFTPFALPFTK
jgi:hypothetical protein